MPKYEGFTGFANRDDYKWAHPELPAELYCFDPHLLETLDPARSYEERKAEIEAVDLTPHYDPERTRSFEAPGCPEEPDAPLVPLTVAYPSENKKRKLPCLLVIPGGGLVACEYSNYPIELWADRWGIAVAVMQYRSILKTPEGGEYPHSINDCHAAYQYLMEHADEIGINAKKIGLWGDSSGSQHALGLCHRLKRYGITPRGCWVVGPILDERLIYPSSHIQSTMWGSDHLNISCREWLQGANPAFVPVEAYANHATVEECVGLPPTFIHAYEHDCGTNPAFEYASKLIQAGVFTTVHEWGGCNHCALTIAAMTDDGSEKEPYVKLFLSVMDNEVKDMFKYDLRRPWTVEEFSAQQE